MSIEEHAVAILRAGGYGMPLIERSAILAACAALFELRKAER